LYEHYPHLIELPREYLRELMPDEAYELKAVLDVFGNEALEELRAFRAHSQPGAGWGELIKWAVLDALERHHPERKAKRAEARADARAQAKAKSKTRAQAATPAGSSADQHQANQDSAAGSPSLQKVETDGSPSSQK